MYRPPYRLRDENIFRGVIAAAPRPVALGSASSTMLIVDRMGATTTIMLGPRTRFPMGTDFEAGEAVVVVGDLVASGTVQAFGIREIDPDPDYGD